MDQSNSFVHPPGTTPIKAEYILSGAAQCRWPVVDDDSAEIATSHASHVVQGIPAGNEGGGARDEDDAQVNGKDADGGAETDGPPKKRKKRLTKEEKKERSGANKGRRFGKMRDEVELCWRTAVGAECDFGDECRFTHNIDAYLASKPRDIKLPQRLDEVDISELVSKTRASSKASTAFVMDETPILLTLSSERKNALPITIDPTTSCPMYEANGECRHGFKCRFLGGHVTRSEANGSLELVKDPEKSERRKQAVTEANFLPPDALKQLRAKKYAHPITQGYLKEIKSSEDGKKRPMNAEVDADGGNRAATFKESELTDMFDESQKDSPDVPLRFNEKKRLKWKNFTYLAPLTTVGNLPFRQLCVAMGADITCGEMGLATSFLQGSKEEWSLVRRHPSERIFGIQLAGSKPHTLAATAETIAREFGTQTVDFVDVNCGCPIDLVFRAGSGSALLDAPGKLSKILIGMNKALGEIPLTVKLRTGVKEGKNSAHRLMPRLVATTGVGAMTLHGRTRQQRYTKLADWDYIRECVEAVRAREEQDDLPQIPLFGGGDCFSAQSYYESLERGNVDGVMVGRGALIKPWIFTEIKERREWDISARERLDLIRKYSEFGLNHFGSDTAGVNTTRRYLCEALSFMHRYVPIGLLEVLPPRINDRPPAFRGRDGLETLLASPNCHDWVHISEFFLGKAPERWHFTPKHKSNAYGSEEGQG